MSMRSDHKALLFLAAIAALGATVRVARAVGAKTPPGVAALEQQMQSADSARRAVSAKRSGWRPGQQPAPPTSARSRSARAAQPASPTASRSEHRDYRGRLDLDLASAAEIDSLPGVGPTLAKRLVVNRITNGPFRELVALRRVRGMTPALMTSLDSLVSFSGVYKPPAPADTIISSRPPKKRR
jgi:competence protein ComEA